MAKSSGANGRHVLRNRLVWVLLITAGIALLLFRADTVDYWHQVRFQTELCIEENPTVEDPVDLYSRENWQLLLRETHLRLCNKTAHDRVDILRSRATIWERVLGLWNGINIADSRYRESDEEWADRMRRKWDELYLEETPSK